MELSDEDLAAAILEAVSTPMGEGFLGAPTYSSEDIAEAKAAVAKHRTIRQQQRAQRRAARQQQDARESRAVAAGMVALGAPSVAAGDGRFLLAGADTLRAVMQCVCALAPLVSCLLGSSHRAAARGPLSEVLAALLRELYVGSALSRAQVSLQPFHDAVLQALPHLGAHPLERHARNSTVMGLWARGVAGQHW